MNLPSKIIEEAYSSLDDLFQQIKTLAVSVFGFPKIYDHYLVYGYQAHPGPIKSLRELDLLLLLSGEGTEVALSPLDSQTYWLKINTPNASLALYPDGHGYVNSKKVIDSLINYLSSLEQCQEVEFNLERKAVTLKLRAYEWSFNLIPAVPVDNKLGERIYYLIPNAQGNWGQITIENEAKIN